MSEYKRNSLMKQKKDKVILSFQDFLSAGGPATYPELCQAGIIRVYLPKDLHNKKLSKKEKEDVLENLLREKAEENGYSHVFYVGYSKDLTSISGDAYKKTEFEYIRKGLVKQVEDIIAREKFSETMNNVFGLMTKSKRTIESDILGKSEKCYLTDDETQYLDE
jgi:hypothetical protein